MTIDDFIARWTDREGGAERANYVMFLSELCEVIGVARPEPAGASREYNDYVFERSVRPRDSADSSAPLRIDLYKKGCFLLEAKQSRLPGKAKEIKAQGKLALDEPEHLGRRSAAKGWDVMMQNARKQGETYVFLLETSQPSPPFLIVCDVGHCFEFFADFSGTGRAYSQFPDRKGFRVYLNDLREPEIRDRLKAIWTDPGSLDPTKHAAAVTREIAARLADVSKSLEARGCNAEDVAHFLMRCLFTMFAEDVELLPKASFQTLLKDSIEDPTHFAFRLKALWKQMDEGEHYSFVIKDRVRKFNGGLFKSTTAFDLDKKEIEELYAAAKHDWKAVDPAIFGTLLEQALDKAERRKLGAHYTPRAYVQRLVDVTIMEPLRADWQAALTKAEQARDDGDEKKAVDIVRAFHHQLCATRVLDPACGTGNFLYVSLELMKKLEGEVLETLAKLGEPESMGFDREEVDPHRFLGLEINPRAAAIAELVIWIGYLQQHYRTRTGHPSEPILKDFKNINFGLRGGYDAVLTWDGYPVPKVVERDGAKLARYPNSRRPNWPQAEFIVGNPPFTGAKRLRNSFGDGYVEALWASSQVDENTNFVMFWWDRAAELLSAKNSILRRFGLVTTNTIKQPSNRKVVQRYLMGREALSIVMAIPDHPWTKVTGEDAAVRIAMSVCQAGTSIGRALIVREEDDLASDDPHIVLHVERGFINSQLSVSADMETVAQLQANTGICQQGVKLVGEGFVLTEREAVLIGSNGPEIVKKYVSGIEIVRKPLLRSVIDFDGLDEQSARKYNPKAYQRLLELVRPLRLKNREKSRREKWWLFGRSNRDMRASLRLTQRFIATPEVAKHRPFVFVESDTIVDASIYSIALEGASFLSILSSRIHVCWSLRAGGRLEDRPRYFNTTCFNPFPFPALDAPLDLELGRAGGDLDRFRSDVLKENPDLTLTGLYNVLEKLKAGAPLTEKDEDIKQRGLVLILKELHEDIDRLTFDAYGWPHDLTDDEILARLVALNAERAKEEAAGHVRWLRPDYQIPRFGKKVAAKTGELDLAEAVVPVDVGLPNFPTDAGEATLAIEAMLATAGKPMTAAEIARGFKRGGKRVEQKVVKALGTLARYGRISVAGEDRFVARRSA